MDRELSKLKYNRVKTRVLWSWQVGDVVKQVNHYLPRTNFKPRLRFLENPTI